MNTFRELIEARSNPELNTRQSSFAELRRYAGEKDIFVSFTSSFSNHNGREVRNPRNQHKIGINPKNSYGTPIGIYCYPVDYILEYSKEKGEITGPYTGRNPWRFLYILRRSSDGYIDSTTDLKPFEAKLHSLMEQMLGEEESSRIIGEATTTANDTSNPRSIFWNTTRLFAMAYTRLETTPSKTYTTAWNVIMRLIGVNQYVDDQGESVIHGSEPTQAVFFTTQAFRVAGMLERHKVSREGGSDEYNAGLAKAINAGKLNLEATNPLAFPGVIHRLDMNGLVWLASKLGAIDKRVINEKLQAGGWPGSVPFNKEGIEALQLFGPLSKDMLISTALNQNMDWTNIEDIIPNMTRRDWKMCWDRAIASASWMSKPDELTDKISEAKVSRSSVLALVDALGTQASETYTAHSVQNYFRPVQKMIENSGVAVEGELAVGLFKAFPREMVKDDRLNLSFADWYRFMRSGNNFKIYGDIIPVKFGKLLLMRSGEGKNGKVFAPDNAWIGRLIEEDERFALAYLIKNRVNTPATGDDPITTLLVKHFPQVVGKNFRLAASLYTHGRLDEDNTRLMIKEAWRESKKMRGYKGVDLIAAAVRAGDITAEEFLANVNKNTAAIGLDYYNWPDYIIPPELKLKCVMMTERWSAISEDMIPFIEKEHPEFLPKLTGHISNETAYRLMNDHWEVLKDVGTVADRLTGKQVWQLMKTRCLKSANPAEEYLYYFYREKDEVLLAALEDEPNVAIEINKDNLKGLFKPLPVSLYMPLASWSALFGKPVRDDLLNRLTDTYGKELFGKFIASPKFMEQYSDRHYGYLATHKVFFNEIPDELRQTVQMKCLNIVTTYYSGDALDRVLHDTITGFYKPTEHVLEVFRDHLERHKAALKTTEDQNSASNPDASASASQP